VFDEFYAENVPQETKREASQVFSPPHSSLTGNPISLTEGGLPVVCWPNSDNTKTVKSVAVSMKKKPNLYGFFITFD